MYIGAETGYFNDNSMYIIQMNKNGRYDARRFWSVYRDDPEEDIIIENATYSEATLAVIELGYEISESLL